MTIEAAWDRLWEALPARWQLGRPSFDPAGDGRWSITARGPHPGRGKAPQTVSGAGATEVEALQELDARLRGTWEPGGRLEELRARLRLAYVEGAEEWTRRNVGRAMTSDELAGVVRRFVSSSPSGRPGEAPGS